MVISLFPKRRRRRRWHGPLNQEAVDPPSFSEIQPEITVREEKTVVTEVSAEVPATPVSRSRRKSTIGTPAPHDRSARLSEGSSDGERNGSRKSSCESPPAAANPRKTRSTSGTPALRELSANTLELDVTENPSGSLESTRVSARRRSSGGQYLDVPQTIGNPRRRSSRLSGNSRVNPSAVRCLTAASDSRRTPRRVSFSLSERTSTHPVSSTLQLVNDREFLATERLSALSDAEENSDYHAFMNGIFDPDLLKKPTRCSRGSMTNSDPYTNAAAAPILVVTENSDDLASKALEQQPIRDESMGKLRVPAGSVPCSIEKQVKAPQISRTELKTVKRTRRVKPETRDARTSTTGLDVFVRSTRRKKSMCVQIDLDKTTAFKNDDPNVSVDEEGAAGHLEKNIDVKAVSPIDVPRTRADINTSVTEHLNLPQLSCEAELNQALRLELPPGGPRDALEERLPTVLVDKCPEMQTRSGNDKDSSHLGIDASLKSIRKASENSSKALTGKLMRENVSGVAESQDNEGEVDRLSVPVAKEVPSEPAHALSRVQTHSGGEESRESAKQPEPSKLCPNAAPERSETTSETTREVLKRSSSQSTSRAEIVGLATGPRGGTPTSTRVNAANKSSVAIAFKPNISVPSTSRNPLPTFPEQENLLETPSLAKRCRTAQEPKRRRRRSSEIDVLGIALRIKEKIERKRLIENTVYRRVNLIYEGLWEDFLQTYCPEKWRKVEDAWMEGKAKKRLEEEQRGLGDLDDEMEREVQRGTELGAAKYIKEFEEKRAEAERRAGLSREKSSNNTVKQASLPLQENRRQSRRLRDLLPL